MKMDMMCEDGEKPVQTKILKTSLPRQGKRRKHRKKRKMATSFLKKKKKVLVSYKIFEFKH